MAQLSKCDGSLRIAIVQPALRNRVGSCGTAEVNAVPLQCNDKHSLSGCRILPEDLIYEIVRLARQPDGHQTTNGQSKCGPFHRAQYRSPSGRWQFAVPRVWGRIEDVNTRRLLEIAIPAGVALVLFLLGAFGVTSGIENRLYDALLRIKPPIEEHPDILFLDVDDTAIAEVGIWPWSRDFMARGLLRLREFENEVVTFDIEYVEPSRQGVIPGYIENDLPLIFDSEIGFVQDNIVALVDALAAGQISVADAQDFAAQLVALADDTEARLLASVQDTLRDNDDFLGRAAAVHREAFFTVNMLEQEEAVLFPASEQWVLSEIRVASGAEALTESYPSSPAVRPAIPEVLTRSAGAGFPNVVVDPDGVRRRIELLWLYEDRYIPQLILSPLLSWLGNPEVVPFENRVELRGALLPDATEPTDIVIPRATDGRLLINWPSAVFLDSFRHITYYELVLHDEEEARLLSNLRALEDSGYLGYYDASTPLLDVYSYTQELEAEMLASADAGEPDEALVAEWREVREFFFTEVERFSGTGTESAIIADINAQIDNAINQFGFPEDDPALVEARSVRDEVTPTFAALRTNVESLMTTRANLAEAVPGSFAIIGWTGTSTTDVGVNPFEEEYMNVGTHMAVANTILQQAFIDDTPIWVSSLIGLVVALLLAVASRQLSPGRSLLAGILAVFLVLGGLGLIFVTRLLFIPLFTPTLIVAVTFLSLTVIKFIAESQEKGEIRNAFGRYLSEDVINELMENPDALGLGGRERNITSMFTDVQGFSSISEALTAPKLVELLNQYLTVMSDQVIQQRGTIDKYEGDAIIAFFGAPNALEDHAVRACHAAIRMRDREKELNQFLADRDLTPFPLVTRIGINTGDAVVGNMGTTTRMDYTAMGHTINLASRLEGVNKQYGTRLLISEMTYEATGRQFAVRKLDRVRVVGVAEPIRIYELIGPRKDIDEDIIWKLRTFNAGLNAFESRQWKAAQEAFAEVLSRFPDDGPAKFYAERANGYSRKSPQSDWDGVYNLTKK